MQEIKIGDTVVISKELIDDPQFMFICKTNWIDALKLINEQFTITKIKKNSSLKHNNNNEGGIKNDKDRTYYFATTNRYKKIFCFGIKQIKLVQSKHNIFIKKICILK